MSFTWTLVFIYTKAIKLTSFTKSFQESAIKTPEHIKKKLSYMLADSYSALQVAQGTDASRIPKVIKSGFPITNIYRVIFLFFLLFFYIFP